MGNITEKEIRDNMYLWSATDVENLQKIGERIHIGIARKRKLKKIVDNINKE